MNKNVKKIYLTFNSENQDEETEGYWDQYESIEDAVATHGDGVEVYEANIQFLGEFKRKVELVKVKSRKNKSK